MLASLSILALAAVAVAAPVRLSAQANATIATSNVAWYYRKSTRSTLTVSQKFLTVFQLQKTETLGPVVSTRRTRTLLLASRSRCVCFNPFITQRCLLTVRLQLYNNTNAVSSYCGRNIVITNLANNKSSLARVADASGITGLLTLSVGAWQAVDGEGSLFSEYLLGFLASRGES